MNNLSRLLGITSVGVSIAKARLVHRFIGDVARIITLAIATGLVAGALLIGGFFVAYQGFVHYGLEPLPAQIFIGLLALATVLALLLTTSSRLRRLRGIPEQIVHTEFPFSRHLNTLADSFMDGLMNSPKPE